MTNPKGRLTVDGDRAVLVFERRLAHPPEAVWAALTEPAHRDRWMGRSAVDGRVGGTIETVASGPALPPDVKRMTGRILVWDPPHVFEHEWNQAIVEPGVVRYELTPDGDGTLLTFTHRGLGIPNADGFRPGTQAFLDRLEAHLDRRPLPNWADRYQDIAGVSPLP
ncbi:SRPBCC family protein [Mycolicibacterium lacusdiani]|uniref:SRPBCC family protein n=1 Tax=Mycolicibacterium lacusdiani TaxID=2895283 RepID=UPI001F256493|nr:SRPBCC family protein [Mycolicibacterium lacusdiani]